METQKEKWQRYRLHQRIKKLGLSYSSHERTLFLSIGMQVSDKMKRVIEKLTKDHGFVIQTEIPQQ